MKDTIITDHLIVALQLNGKMANENKITVRPRNYNRQLLSAEIHKLSFSFNYREANLDKKYEKFYENIMHIVNVVIPKKEIIPKKDTCHPWFNNEVLGAIKQRDLYYKKFLLTKNQTHWDLYKTYRNRVVPINK